MNTTNYAHLEPVGKHAPASIVAKNVRKDLKLNFTKVKFSVVSDSHSCIRVKWIDGPTAKQVEAVLGKFQPGRFNGMEDIYEHASTPFSNQYGSVDYLFCSREPSDKTIQKAIDLLWLALPIELIDCDKPIASDMAWCWDRRLIAGTDMGISETIRSLAHSFDCMANKFIVDNHPGWIIRRVLGVENHVAH